MPPEEQSKPIEFADIAKLSNRDVQSLLRSIEGKGLALALKGADEAVRDRIFENVSRRVAALLRDEMKLHAAAKFSDVREARDKLTQTARQLQTSGEITWPPAITPGAQTAQKQPPPPKPSTPPTGQNQRRQYIYGLVGTVAGIVLLVTLTLWLGGKKTPSSSTSEKNASPKQVMPSSQTSAQSATPGNAVPSNETMKSTIQSATPSTETGNAQSASAQEAKRPAEENILQPGEQMKTGDTEQKEISLPDNAGHLQVEPNTELQAADTNLDSDAPPRLEMRLGNVQVNVQDPTLEVNAPLATLTAPEGTQYKLQAVLNTTTTISVTQGTVWVKLKVESEKEYLVLGPGETLRIEPSGKLIKGKLETTDK